MTDTQPWYENEKYVQTHYSDNEEPYQVIDLGAIVQEAVTRRNEELVKRIQASRVVTMSDFSMGTITMEEAEERVEAKYHCTLNDVIKMIKAP